MTFITITKKLFSSILTDLKSFKWWQIVILAFLCCVSIIFSFIDFNHFITPDINTSPYSWINDDAKGLEQWRRGLMILSGIASFSGIMSVVLAAKGKYSTYFWGIINCIAYGLFAFAYGYGGDAQLNIFFFLPLQFVGIYAWRDNLDSEKIAIPRSLKWWKWSLIVLPALVLSIAFYYEIPPFTEAIAGEGTYPYQPVSSARILDSATNALNIVAQILLIYRFWEQWILWVAVDCMQIAMFTGVGGFGININIVIMWCIFLINALYGLYSWFKRWYKSDTIGVVIGKFYPLHNGHQHLIKTAIESDITVLHIILCYKQTEFPNINIRFKWMSEFINDYSSNRKKVIYIHKFEDKDYDPTSSVLWANLTVELIDCVPDFVFTSEDYGHAYAKCLSVIGNKKCKHILVDKERKIHSISGTSMRANPLKNFSKVPANVRMYYGKILDVKRIVLVGPESTGKTTLCQYLSNVYETVWCPEYGREKTIEKYDNKNIEWTSTDFIEIAEKQCNIEEEAKHQAVEIDKNFIICDTDVLATCIWHERYMNGSVLQELKIILEDRKPGDLYLLTKPDCIFVQCGYRDGENIRDWMFNRFVEMLQQYECNYEILEGSFDERNHKAVECINNFLNIKETELKHLDNLYPPELIKQPDVGYMDRLYNTNRFYEVNLADNIV